MNTTNDSQPSSVAKWVFPLFGFGIMVPFVLALFVLWFFSGFPDLVAGQVVLFGVALGAGVAQILVLILGVVWARHLAGNVRWIGLAAVVGLTLLAEAALVIRFGSVVFGEAGPSGNSVMRSASGTAAAGGPVLEAPTTLPAGAAEAIRRQDEAAKALGVGKELVLDLGKGVTMKLVLIPAGKFMMGSPGDENGRSDVEGPQHEVAIGQPFYLGAYEVTQEQYERIMGRNLSSFQGARNPAELVSWDDAVEFCAKLSQRVGKTVQLPTEAQWEYACRAGTKTPFSTGRTISASQANYSREIWGTGRRGEYVKPVAIGSYRPNAWGLHDMHGNVYEWCSDLYTDHYATAAGGGPASAPAGSFRVMRGGSWNSIRNDCRSASRYGLAPHVRLNYIGFRVVVTAGAD